MIISLHIVYRPNVDISDLPEEIQCIGYMVSDGVLKVKWENQYLIVPLDMVKYIRASEVKEHKKPTGND